MLKPILSSKMNHDTGKTSIELDKSPTDVNEKTKQKKKQNNSRRLISKKMMNKNS
jgi:hypothetical protein